MPATRITHPATRESLIGIKPQLLQQVPPPKLYSPSTGPSYWRQRLNLFTGRALTATALESEQAYRSGLLATMGQSVTPGTVKGLELSMRPSGSDDALFTVTPGYGIVASGEDITLLRAMQTTLNTLAVIDPATGEALQKFQDFAADPGNKTPAGILLLQPIVAQVSGQVMDTGTGPIEITGNLNASCDQDPQEYAFEDWQIADGVRLVFFPWPAGVAALTVPDSTQQATWRNRLVYTIFAAERQLSPDDVLPWSMLGLPVALIGFNSAWKPLFIDRSAVVRAGGLPRKRYVLPRAPVSVPAWQASTSFAMGQFIQDSNGNIQMVQVAGRSGSAPPKWSTALGQTTPNDGSVTWINNGPGSWQPNTAFTVGQFIVDSNGNVQSVIAVEPSGKSGSKVPPWNGVNLQTSDGGITWMNKGNGTPLVVQPALAQARLSQLSEQLSDVLSQQQTFTTLADIFPILPPSGVLPIRALNFVRRDTSYGSVLDMKNAWFPPNWALSAGPVRNEELETVLQTSMTEEVLGALPSAPPDPALNELVQVLVPLPDEVYDPNILVHEEPAPEFLQEVDRATQDRDAVLRRRRAIQLEANALLVALGPNSPSNPNLIGPDGDLTSAEIQARNALPPYLPGANEVFGTVLPSTWRSSMIYAANALIVDANGNIQLAQGSGTSDKSPPAWGTAAGVTTKDGTISWVNGGSCNWQPNTSYAPGQFILDSKGNVQTVQSSGVSSATQPPWNATLKGSTNDGMTWVNNGKKSWQPNSSYVAGQTILDPNNNVQIVRKGGTSGDSQPFTNLSQPVTLDGGVIWANLGHSAWQANTSYAANQVIVDPNGNIEITQSGGTSGKVPPTWNAAQGQTTLETPVVWINSGTVLWQANTVYTAGQLIVDSNGNFQSAQATGKSGVSQPAWNSSPGQTATDGGITWMNLSFVSVDIQQLQNQAGQKPYTFSFTDSTKTPYTRNLVTTDDWNDLQSYGLQHFIGRLNSKIKQANDLIDRAFLTVQTDIYRYRQNVLDATTAQKLAVSPVLASIATTDTAAATAKNLQDYIGSILPSTTPKPAPPPPPGGWGAGRPAPVSPESSIAAHATQFRMLAARTGGVRLPGSVQTPGGTGLSPAFSIPQLPTVAGSGNVRTLTGLGPQTLARIPTPGETVSATPTEIQGQSPIPGAQLNIRTLTVAERMQQSPSQESLFYSVGNRVSFLQLLEMLAKIIIVDDLQVLVDGATPTPPAGATVPANPVPVDDSHRFLEWLDDTKKASLLLKVHSPVVPTNADEATLFSVGVRVLEQHTTMLRALEGRVQLYVDFVSLCTTVLANLQSDLQGAQSLLQTLQNDLAQARQNVAFTASLYRDEIARVNSVNARRTQVLQGVTLIAYTRPRSIQAADGTTPSRQLVPGNIANPVPACLQQSVSIPAELREFVVLLREAPVNWLPSVQSLLNSLERVSLLQELGASAQARAAFQLQMSLHVSSARGEPGVYAPVIASVYIAQQQVFRSLQAQRSSFQPASLAGLSWAGQVAALQSIVALADLTFSAAVHTEVANTTTRLMQQIASVATCLYTRAGVALPIDRLAWADFLTGPGLTIQMQSLAVLPNWNAQPYTDRQQMQMLVDWLFLQIDTSISGALAFMSDLVRTSILLASDVPVDHIIASNITVRTQPAVGGLVSLSLSSDRIAKGMYVQLYSGRELAARAVVSDLDMSTVSATITDVYKAGAYLETTDTAHFTAQTPQAVALRPFLNQS